MELLTEHGIEGLQHNGIFFGLRCPDQVTLQVDQILFLGVAELDPLVIVLILEVPLLPEGHLHEGSFDLT